MPAWDKIPKISKYKIPEVAQYLRDLITEIVLYTKKKCIYKNLYSIINIV